LWNADADANVKPDGNVYTYRHINAYPNTYGAIYTHSNTYGDGYSCLTHTDMCARQSIHDSSDWRQYRAGHHRHRQSRG